MNDCVRRLVFLAEEKSACNLLDGLLPKILPKGAWLCIPHRGKNDLKKSIPRKLKAWQNPEDRFVILHDQDANDCRQLKADLRKKCEDAGKSSVVIRIICRELESWYWGDLNAVAKAYPKFRPGVGSQSRYRYPDSITHPAHELKKHIPEFNKGAASRNICRYMEIHGNKSPSFNQFIESVLALKKHLHI